MSQFIQLNALGRMGVVTSASAPIVTADALLTEAGEEIITEDGFVIIHEDTEP